MSMYLPRAARSLFNTPLAFSADRASDLYRVTNDTMPGLARVRGLDRVPEVDAQAALARLRGMDAPDRRGRPYALSPNGIAMVSVFGDLVRSCDIWDMIFGGVTSYEMIAEQISVAGDDPDTKAVFVHFNSSGGYTDGMVECSDLIHRLSARNGGKPIYGYAGDRALSAAYLLLSACDQAFVSETGSVGSTGVMAIYIEASRALEEEGLTPHVFRSRPGKAVMSGIEPLPDAERDRVQRQIEYLGSVYEKRVALYRPNLSQSAVAAANALDYIALDAKATGLVNDVISMQDAWAKLERKIARK